MTERTYLKDVMKSAGITQAEMAEVAGVHKSQISKIISGKTNPSIKVWCRIAFELSKYDDNFDIMGAVEWEVTK